MQAVLPGEVLLRPVEAGGRGQLFQAQPAGTDQLGAGHGEHVIPLVGGDEGADLAFIGHPPDRAVEAARRGQHPVVLAVGCVAEGPEALPLLPGPVASAHQPAPELGEVLPLGRLIKALPGDEGPVFGAVEGTPEVGPEVEVGLHVHVDLHVETRCGGARRTAQHRDPGTPGPRDSRDLAEGGVDKRTRGVDPVFAVARGAVAGQEEADVIGGAQFRLTPRPESAGGALLHPARCRRRRREQRVLHRRQIARDVDEVGAVPVLPDHRPQTLLDASLAHPGRPGGLQTAQRERQPVPVDGVVTVGGTHRQRRAEAEPGGADRQQLQVGVRAGDAVVGDHHRQIGPLRGARQDVRGDRPGHPLPVTGEDRTGDEVRPGGDRLQGVELRELSLRIDVDAQEAGPAAHRLRAGQPVEHLPQTQLPARAALHRSLQRRDLREALPLYLAVAAADQVPRC